MLNIKDEWRNGEHFQWHDFMVHSINSNSFLLLSYMVFQPRRKLPVFPIASSVNCLSVCLSTLWCCLFCLCVFYGIFYSPYQFYCVLDFTLSSSFLIIKVDGEVTLMVMTLMVKLQLLWSSRQVYPTYVYTYNY